MKLMKKTVQWDATYVQAYLQRIRVETQLPLKSPQLLILAKQYNS